MTGADRYIAAAYLVVLLAVLAYVAIISLKLARFEREVAELEALARARFAQERPVRELVSEEARHG